MGLKPKLDSLEGLSEDIQAYYIEKDGAYYLDVEDSALKNAFNKTKEEAKDLKDQLEKQKQINEQSKKGNHAEVARLQAELKSMQEADMSAEERFRKKSEELDNLKKEYNDLQESSKMDFEKYKLSNTIKSALINAGAKNDAKVLSFLEKAVAEKAKFDNETNSFLFFDKDGSHEKRQEGSSAWEPRTALDAVYDLIDSKEYDNFFNVQVKKGFKTSPNLNSRARTEYDRLSKLISEEDDPRTKMDLLMQRDGI